MNNAYLERAKERIPDPQILSVVAAKRARQLAQGARPMIKCDSSQVLDVALLEIAEGLLSYEFGDEVPAGEEKAADTAETAEAEPAEAEKQE